MRRPAFIYSLSLWLCFSGHFIEMESHTTWPFVPDFCHRASRFQGPSMLWQMSLFSYVSWPNNIPLCGDNTFCRSIHLLMGILMVSTFLRIVTSPRTFMSGFLRRYTSSCLLSILAGLALPDRMIIPLNPLINFVMLFCGGCTISHFPWQKGSDFSTSSS